MCRAARLRFTYEPEREAAVEDSAQPSRGRFKSPGAEPASSINSEGRTVAMQGPPQRSQNVFFFLGGHTCLHAHRASDLQP